MEDSLSISISAQNEGERGLVPMDMSSGKTESDESRESRTRRRIDFAVSIAPSILGLVAVSVVFAGAAFERIIRARQANSADATSLGVAAALLTLAYLQSRGVVWTSYFYEHYASIGRVRVRGRVDYFQISEVRRKDERFAFRPPNHVVLFFRDGRPPIEIPGNPRSAKLGTDLFSWLKERVETGGLARTG